MNLLWRTVAAGAIATLSMDLLSALAYWLRLSAPLPPYLIGRWFAYVAKAKLFHADIANVPAVPHEIAIAVPVHYAIGVALTTCFVRALSYGGQSPRNLPFALAFGVSTNLLPWLVMFPSMGYGFFGSHGPAGTRLFLSSLMSHAIFGLGLWLGVMAAGVR